MRESSIAKLKKLNRDNGNQYYLETLRKSIRQNSQKISKSIYNLESRNIKLFNKEWLAFQKKIKDQQNQTVKKIIVPPKTRFGRVLKYEENETLQLQHDKEIPFEKKQNLSNLMAQSILDKTGSIGKSTLSRIVKRKSTNKLSVKINLPLNDFSKESLAPLREKSLSLMRERKNTVRSNRIATQWDLSRQKLASSHLSNNRYEGTELSNQKYHKVEALIDLTKERMDKFIKNLHKIQWSYEFIKSHKYKKVENIQEYKDHLKNFKYDIDCPISDEAINYMISHRYELFTYHLQDQYEKNLKKINSEGPTKKISLSNVDEYSLLDSLSKFSILHLMNRRQVVEKKRVQIHEMYLTEPIEKESQVNFALPFAQFISYRETKASIYRLISMNSKSYFKMAFSIFDKNKNGVIDEDDLLQMISLSRKQTILQHDIVILSKAMLTPKQAKKPFFNRSKLRVKSQRNSQQPNSANSHKSRQRTDSHELFISPIKQEDFNQSQNQATQNKQMNSRFSLQKMYIFLKDKEISSKRRDPITSQNIQSLSFCQFCKAFDNKIPFVIYDLFQYIFGASIEDFSQKIKNQIKSQFQKIHLTIQKAQFFQPAQQTLQQKWNKRLKNTNTILTSLVQHRQLK